MNNAEFNGISLKGRVAFGINCFEETLIILKCDISKWEFVLEKLWTFMSVEFLDDWYELVAEILPECVLESKEYSEDYEHITEKEFYYLHELYKNIDYRLQSIMELLFRIGESHSYSVIVNNGAESLENVQKLIDFMSKNNLPVPDIEKYKKLSVNENNGWGNRFNGESLSILLNRRT